VVYSHALFNKAVLQAARRFSSYYLPYVLIGIPVDLYFESDVLRGPWVAVGWGLVGLAAGCCVDLAYRSLPAQQSLRTKAILMGIVLGAASFLLTLMAQAFFYRVPLPTDPGSFVGVAYFGLPWLLITSAFGGYTAYAISWNA
jgi:hypothetical protein